MGTPPVRDDGILMIANADPRVKSPEDRARQTTTTTFTEHLLVRLDLSPTRVALTVSRKISKNLATLLRSFLAAIPLQVTRWARR